MTKEISFKMIRTMAQNYIGSNEELWRAHAEDSDNSAQDRVDAERHADYWKGLGKALAEYPDFYAKLERLHSIVKKNFDEAGRNDAKCLTQQPANREDAAYWRGYERACRDILLIIEEALA